MDSHTLCMLITFNESPEVYKIYLELNINDKIFILFQTEIQYSNLRLLYEDFR